MRPRYHDVLMIFIIAAVALIGCAHTVIGHINERQLEEIVTLARGIVLNHYPDLDGPSKKIIQEESPYLK